MAERAQGALTMGMIDQAELSSLVDNIITHLADPNNLEAELAYKETSHTALRIDDPEYYNDTIIYNWMGSQAYDNLASGDGIRNPDTNIDGLDSNVLDQTTIQNFTALLLGKETATIADLADYLRAQADGAFADVVDADLIIKFFQAGFGLTPELDYSVETLTFVPDDLGEGMRWDNRLNWDHEYLPQDGQNVDLNGNWVYYNGTSHIGDLDFGSGGKLHITGGLLDVTGDLTAGEAGAELTLDGAGQFWTDGYSDSDLLTIDAEGGRFANTGIFDGKTDFEVSDNAQAILATDGARFDLSDGSELEIIGDDVLVGFDGDGGGIATLRLDDNATLSFVAEEGELGEIGEFRSGKFGDAPDVRSGIHLGDGNLVLDLTGINGAYETTLLSADMLIGTFDDITMTGLGADRDATITVDYETDTVTLKLTAAGAGSGQLSYDVLGDSTPDAGEADLWDALTAGQGTYSDIVPDAEPDADEEPLLHVA